VEAAADARAVLEGGAQDAAISCMFLWIILAALAFGAVFDGIGAPSRDRGAVHHELGALALGGPHDDAALVPRHGHVPRRHRHAGDRRAALRAAGRTLDLGIDNVLIWYGVLYTITCQIAYMTPPFGYNLFLMRAMAPLPRSAATSTVGHRPSWLVMLGRPRC
jgi:TRAP-type mannitol/chloroaromatic compound transport system permease large subunit